MDGAVRHTVRFFGGTFPASDVASFLAHGGGALVVASKRHTEMLIDELRIRSVNVEEAIASGELVFASAEEVCDAMIADGGPTEERFLAIVGTVVDDLVARRGTISVYGEVVDLFAQRARPDDAIELERLWTGLLGRRPVRLLCGYGFASLASTDGVRKSPMICELHEPHEPLEADETDGD
jgi:hypothetical protein